MPRAGTSNRRAQPAPRAASVLASSARYQAPRRRRGAALRALRCASGTRQRHRLPARWPCAGRAPLLGSSHARGACAPASRCGGQSGKPSRRARELRAVRWRGLGSARGCGAPREVRRGPASLRSHRAASGFGCRLRLALAAARNLPLLWPSPPARSAILPVPPREETPHRMTPVAIGFKPMPDSSEKSSTALCSPIQAT